MGCDEDCEPDSLACWEHTLEWRRHRANKSKSTLNGIRRIIQRPNETQPWQQNRIRRLQQPHDEDQNVQVRRHYFSPNKFYCVETICTPCGVVLAWTLFDKAESPSNILHWLDTVVYPNKEDRPTYICIDKACLVSVDYFLLNRSNIMFSCCGVWHFNHVTGMSGLKLLVLLWTPITIAITRPLMNYAKFIATLHLKVGT